MSIEVVVLMRLSQHLQVTAFRGNVKDDKKSAMKMDSWGPRLRTASHNTNIPTFIFKAEMREVYIRIIMISIIE
jgi:hypothetical protein